MPKWKNKLYIGDNLVMLREYVPDESVDLIYLDPPFNSNASYNVLFRERTGSVSVAQITAFEDTWHWGDEAERSYQEVISGGPTALADLFKTLRTFLGRGDMMAYLAMIAPRMIELHRVLKPTGSIYLHCDPTASHYLKVLMDAVFSPGQFRNEIIWKRSHSHNSARRYGPIHDTLLFYTKSDKYTWTDERQPYGQDYIDRFFKFNDGDGRGRYWTGDLTASGVRHGKTGEPWRGFDPSSKGRHWMVPPDVLDELDRDRRIYWPKTVGAWPKLKRYLDEAKGNPLQDIVDDIYGLATMGGPKGERLGYPTQKPEALLERIIRASSNDGDVVMDPFCGCGTAVVVAERLNRPWIGIDITHLAISLIKSRLRSTYGPELNPYEVVGSPVDPASVRALLGEPNGRYQFQWWACGLIDAHPAQDRRKGADSGVDGYLYFFDDVSDEPKKVIVQVKSGQVSVRDIRDLRGVVEREGAVIGAFISLEEPTKPMLKEAVSAGFYEPHAFYGHRKYPKIQILTVKGLLEGNGLRLPPSVIDTYKRAPRREKNLAKKVELIKG